MSLLRFCIMQYMYSAPHTSHHKFVASSHCQSEWHVILHKIICVEMCYIFSFRTQNNHPTPVKVSNHHSPPPVHAHTSRASQLPVSLSSVRPPHREVKVPVRRHTGRVCNYYVICDFIDSDAECVICLDFFLLSSSCQ